MFFLPHILLEPQIVSSAAQAVEKVLTTFKLVLLTVGN
jgi:hypothetical protein